MNYNFCVDASMGRTDAEQFTMTWFYRALACSDKIDASSPNAGQRRIDLGDRFMSLWICFNSIVRDLYGESLSDNALITEASKPSLWTELFEKNKKSLNPYLDELMKYDVKNMKTGKVRKLKTKTFEELIWVIYDIRCNLFHGRKNPYDFEGSKDFKLISLAFLILSEIILQYLTDKELVSLAYTENYLSMAGEDIPEPTLSIDDYEEGLIFQF